MYTNAGYFIHKVFGEGLLYNSPVKLVKVKFLRVRRRWHQRDPDEDGSGWPSWILVGVGYLCFTLGMVWIHPNSIHFPTQSHH